jgi:hypothetical protein
VLVQERAEMLAIQHEIRVMVRSWVASFCWLSPSLAHTLHVVPCMCAFALAQRQLSHKNIVSFIDSAIISAHSKQAFQSAADEVYILMENCSGSIVTHHLSASLPLLV